MEKLIFLHVFHQLDGSILGVHAWDKEAAGLIIKQG